MNRTPLISAFARGRQHQSRVQAPRASDARSGCGGPSSARLGAPIAGDSSPKGHMQFLVSREAMVGLHALLTAPRRPEGRATRGDGGAAYPRSTKSGWRLHLGEASRLQRRPPRGSPRCATACSVNPNGLVCVRKVYLSIQRQQRVPLSFPCRWLRAPALDLSVYPSVGGPIAV